MEKKNEIWKHWAQKLFLLKKLLLTCYFQSKSEDDTAEQIKVEPEVDIAAALGVAAQQEPEVVDSNIELQIKVSTSITPFCRKGK